MFTTHPQSRAFNELTIDPVQGTVTKRSSKPEKFIDEIDYLRLVPPDVASLFPRVLGYSTTWDDSWLQMEYCEYPPLCEPFVLGEMEPDTWEAVFVHLKRIVTEVFGQHKKSLRKGVMREMLLEKTRLRLAEMKAPDEIVSLAHKRGPVQVNGRTLVGLPDLLEAAEEAIPRLEETAQGQMIHGDLCLSNILYDLASQTCILIDPRGSFGDRGHTGDRRYDVAKLFHSIHGGYDFITCDRFEFWIDGASVGLQIETQPARAEIERRFESVFFPDFDRGDTLLICGLLFASMPALHYDAPRRQGAMIVRAIELLNEALWGTL